MKILAETHTHSNASTHAFASYNEMINAAKEKGMELLSITDHGPAIHDSPYSWHFFTKSLPYKINGVYVLRGAEANIIDYKGKIDIAPHIINGIAPVIASFHRPVLPPGSKDEVTRAYLSVMNNPHVDILGHCGTAGYEFDIDAVLKEIKRLNKLVEINSHTFKVRKSSAENCEKIAKRCKDLGVKIVLSTDAHSTFDIGDLKAAKELIERLGIGEELIQNTTAEKFLKHLYENGRDVFGIYEEEFICSSKAF